jgi:phage-related minor tail protein
MASRNLARLGVVLGLDTAEWEQDINAAIAANKKLSREIKADTNAAEKEILRLKFATEDYGKTLTQVDVIQREISNGRYANATQKHKEELLAQARAYDAVANASKKAGFAMSDQQKIALSYQTTDLVTQIASGGNPLIALMQQGGQLKDQMGGFGNMFKALGTMFTPFNVAVGAAIASLGAFGLAAIKGANEVDGLKRALALTGNMAGLTQGTFTQMAKSMSDDSTITIGNAKDVLMQLANTGLYGAEAMKSTSAAILQFSKLADISGKEAADKLIPALDGSASSAKRLNEQYHFLTFEQYRHIELLEKQGRQQEAIIYTSDLLTKKLKDQDFELNLLGETWKHIKDWASSAWDAMMGVGRAETVEDRIKKVQGLLANLPGETDALGNIIGPGNAEKLQAELDVLLQKKSDADQKALAESKKAADEQRKIADYAFAGGDAKATSLRQERQKLELQNRYEQAKLFASEIQRVELDADEKTALAILEMQKKNEAERGVFAVQNARVLNEQIVALERDKDKQIRDIRLKAYIEESVAAQQQLEEAQAVSAEFINNRQKELAVIREVNRAAEINAQAEQDKINMKLKMFGATQKEIDLAMIQIDKAKELALLERENLSPEAFDLKKAGIEEAYKRKEAMAELTEQMRKAGQVHEAIFGNMEKALEDFVKNGKFAFNDFAKSIIQDLMLIEMKLQATAMLKAMLKGAGGFFSGLFGGGDPLMGMGEGKYIPGYADGGFVPANQLSVVGENGPELFLSGSSGTIIPNSALAMGGGPTINYNGPFIQNMSAIDTQSGIAFLSKNKQAVWAANQSAQRSLPVSR